MKPLKSKWKTALKLAGGGLGLLVIVFWTIGIGRDRVAPATLPQAAGTPLPPEAERFTVQAESIVDTTEVMGTVRSEHMAHLSARVQAHVEEVLVHPGDRVARGDLLIRLDQRELAAAVMAAEAELHRAETDYQRIRRLYEEATVSEREFIAAQSLFQSMQAQLDQARVGLTFSEVRAPLAGVVADRFVEVGSMAEPGMRLISVFDPDTMRLDVPVPVRLIYHISLGDSLRVRLEPTAVDVTGHVHRIVREVDPQSRTQTVQLLLDTTDPTILPGHFGRAEVQTDARETLRIPVEAIQRTGQLEHVFLVDDTRLIQRLVRTGTSGDGWIEILAGLRDGEVILRSAQAANQGKAEQ